MTISLDSPAEVWVNERAGYLKAGLSTPSPLPGDG
jgi:hypothetical protein